LARSLRSVFSAVETWEGLVHGRSGIGPITRFDAALCSARIAGEVRGFDPTKALASPLFPRGRERDPVLAPFTPKDLKKFGRFTHLGVTAAVEAYSDSGLDPHRASLDSERMGVNLGVGIGGLPEIEAMHDVYKAGGFRKISPFLIIQIAPNLLSGQASLLLDLRGPNMSIASACATSGHALGESAAAIARGDADVMIAGGAESTVSPLAIGAFAQMRALSTRNDAPEKASRPYDAQRDGFVLSEGAVVFVLEEMEHAIRRGARIYAELRGYGASADAYHLSSLAEGAEGSQRSMRRALATAGLAATDIDFVSAHATSTPGGDGEEAVAIATVFAANKANLHVSATKVDGGPPTGRRGRDGRVCRGAGYPRRCGASDHQPRRNRPGHRDARFEHRCESGGAQTGARGPGQQFWFWRDQRVHCRSPALALNAIHASSAQLGRARA
jgi:3-oxoacyl-[acyl-carrier-protein] synthase II